MRIRLTLSDVGAVVNFKQCLAPIEGRHKLQLTVSDRMEHYDL